MIDEARHPSDDDLMDILREVFSDPAVNQTDATSQAVRGIQKVRPGITAPDALATVRRLLRDLS